VVTRVGRATSTDEGDRAVPIWFAAIAAPKLLVSVALARGPLPNASGQEEQHRTDPHRAVCNTARSAIVRGSPAKDPAFHTGEFDRIYAIYTLIEPLGAVWS
jgi:hypothetical protein